MNPKEDTCIYGSLPQQIVPGSQEELDKRLSIEWLD